jgi:hypothetical protein
MGRLGPIKLSDSTIKAIGAELTQAKTSMSQYADVVEIIQLAEDFKSNPEVTGRLGEYADSVLIATYTYRINWLRRELEKLHERQAGEIRMLRPYTSTTPQEIQNMMRDIEGMAQKLRDLGVDAVHSEK